MTTRRERMLATLRGEPTDALPCVPRLDLWYKANSTRGTLPRKYQKATLTEIVDDLDVGYHSIVPDFLDFSDPLDEVDRALGIYRLRTEIGDIPPAEKEEMYYAEQELNEKASCVR
jgi:hypothetical protein